MRVQRTSRATHEVRNQPPPLEDYNLFEHDVVLREAVEREGGAWGLDRLSRFGATVGGEPLRLGVQADRNPPVLRTHDRYGHRIDDVQFHPAWTELQSLGIREGIPSLPWRDPPRREPRGPGGGVLRAVPGRVGRDVPPVDDLRGRAGPSARPFAGRGVGASVPRCRPRHVGAVRDGHDREAGRLGRPGELHARRSGRRARGLRTHRHKWFCSHPVCDAFLVLAQAPGGLSCFLLPRVLPDGSRNTGFRIMRLKDKLGTRALASAEVEFEGAVAWMVGEEGRGVLTIIEMVNHTRLDCVLGSAAGMRRAVAEATHHAAHRSAFGSLLLDQPLMRNVLADLCLESEAATLTAIRLARSYDADFEPPELKRAATAVAKYWVCKRATPVAAEALECLGGNGFVEESPMPRLLRDSPLNSIWEGSGNVIALDVLRALTKEPGSFEALMAEVGLAAGADPRLDAAVIEARRELESLAGDGDQAQHLARRVVELLALVLQASWVVRHSPPFVAEAFLASRLAGHWGRTFGTLPPGVDCDAIIDRHRPKLRDGFRAQPGTTPSACP